MEACRAAEFLAGAPEADPLTVVTHGATGKVLRGLYARLAPGDGLALDEPQNAIFLSEGVVARIEIGLDVRL